MELLQNTWMMQLQLFLLLFCNSTLISFLLQHLCCSLCPGVLILSFVGLTSPYWWICPQSPASLDKYRWGRSWFWNWWAKQHLLHGLSLSSSFPLPLQPKYLNEALLLMAKVHYVQGRYWDAQGMCARVGLEELTKEDQPTYHLRLLAEAFVIKGTWNHEGTFISGVNSDFCLCRFESLLHAA